MSCRMKRYDNSFKRKVQKKEQKICLPLCLCLWNTAIFFKNVGKCCFPFRFLSSMLFFPCYGSQWDPILLFCNPQNIESHIGFELHEVISFYDEDMIEVIDRYTTFPPLEGTFSTILTEILIVHTCVVHIVSY